MDIVKSIMDQLSGDNLDRISSQLGTSPNVAQAATAAAVPTILSSLAGLATSPDGMKKLSSTLGGLNLEKLGGLTSMLGDADAIKRQGGNLLTSLFGDGLVSNITKAVGRFASLDEGMTKTLLSMVTPLILGKLGAAWQNKGGTASALQALFADQKGNISQALPSGFSLSSIPGLPSADAALRTVGNAAGAAASDATRRAAGAGKSMASWVLPAGVFLLAGLAAWYYFGRRPDLAQDTAEAAKNATTGATSQVTEKVTALRPVLPNVPEIPDITAISKDASGVFTSATQTLSEIRDAASAQAALPKLTELNGKLDGIKNQVTKLPAAGQSALRQTIGKYLAPLQELVKKILAMPGLNDQVKEVLAGITSKLAALNRDQVSQ